MPIRILDAAVVGRIAAGEVVERPASVVKELMENSLDAGATSVTVEIKGGGMELIRVTDNGCGIEAGQVRLAFENHATSKISVAEQLSDIATFGFRGEALPSIAAVSHVEMTTRAKNQDSGSRLNIDGGENMRVREIGCPEGTTICIRDLFYNIPVRRTFLKSAKYEGSLVGDVVAKILIGNPNVSVRFINNEKTVWHSFGDGKLRNALFSVYGKEIASNMLEMDESLGGVRLLGMIGIGDCAKQSRAQQMFFVNGRSVRCAMLSRALEHVCQGRVTVGMYPMCALSLILPPHSVDVNVHPNKLEVRFRDEVALYETVVQLFSRVFAHENMLENVLTPQPEPDAPVTSVAEIPSAMPPVTEKQPTAEEEPTKHAPLPPFLDTLREPAFLREDAPPKTDADTSANTNTNANISVETPSSKPAPVGQTVQTVKMPSAQSVQEEMPITRAEQMPSFAERKIPEFRVIGVLMKTYILVETSEGLVMIDQHAAHERLRYEKYIRALEENCTSQRLLIPQLLRLSPREMTIVEENAEALRQAGYELEAFGESDMRILAVPMIMGKTDVRPLLMEAIGTLGGMKSMTLDARREEIMQLSCKGAVKAGDSLSDSEIDALLREMLASDAPPTCPHGRPIARVLTRRDIEKMFKRIQP